MDISSGNSKYPKVEREHTLDGLRPTEKTSPSEAVRKKTEEVASHALRADTTSIAPITSANAQIASPILETDDSDAYTEAFESEDSQDEVYDEDYAREATETYPRTEDPELTIDVEATQAPAVATPATSPLSGENLRFVNEYSVALQVLKKDHYTEEKARFISSRIARAIKGALQNSPTYPKKIECTSEGQGLSYQFEAKLIELPDLSDSDKFPIYCCSKDHVGSGSYKEITLAFDPRLGEVFTLAINREGKIKSPEQGARDVSEHKTIDSDSAQLREPNFFSEEAVLDSNRLEGKDYAGFSDIEKYLEGSFSSDIAKKVPSEIPSAEDSLTEQRHQRLRNFAIQDFSFSVNLSIPDESFAELSAFSNYSVEDLSEIPTEDMTDLIKELPLVKALAKIKAANAENIMRFKRVCALGSKNSGKLHFLAAFYDKGTSSSYVNSTTNPQDRRARAFLIARDIIHGLAQCEELGIAHRDIKDTNILVRTQGARIQADIADLDGICQREDSEIIRSDDGRTIRYASPYALSGKSAELWERNPACDPCKDDLFSAGVTIYKLLKDELPPKVQKRGQFGGVLSSLSVVEASEAIRNGQELTEKMQAAVKSWTEDLDRTDPYLDLCQLLLEPFGEKRITAKTADLLMDIIAIHSSIEAELISKNSSRSITASRTEEIQNAMNDNPVVRDFVQRHGWKIANN